MELSIFYLGGERGVLAGAIPGRNLLATLIQNVRPTTEPTPLFLKFDGVEVATSSFLREAVLGVRDYCRNLDTNLYPVIANANDYIIEELKIILEDRGDAIISCNLDDRGVTLASVIGVLEEKQELTLDAVKRLKRADASALMKKFGQHENIKVTGWNNRLAALAAKGILMEVRKGRTKFYQPVLEVL